MLEAGAQMIVERGSEDEAERFDADKSIVLGALVFGGQRLNGALQTIRMFEQGCDVVEVDPRFGKVRDFANELS